MDVFTDVLSEGKNSRLYRSLVYEEQVAQSVAAYQNGSEIAGQLGIMVTAKPGKTLTEMETMVNEEIVKVLSSGVTDKEIQKSINNKAAQLVNSRSTVLGKANSLATYHTLTGDAHNINTELDRFSGITPDEILTTARRILNGNKVVLSVVPEGKPELAAEPEHINPKGGVE
jgi:zinc protease